MSVTTMLSHWFGGNVVPNSRSEHGGSPNCEITAGDFRLDVIARQAYLDGGRLSLSAAEFDLLRFLITHRKMLGTPHTVLSTACDALKIRRTEFLKNLLSLKRKLDDASGSNHYLHIEPWFVYEFDLTAGEPR